MYKQSKIIYMLINIYHKEQTRYSTRYKKYFVKKGQQPFDLIPQEIIVSDNKDLKLLSNINKLNNLDENKELFNVSNIAYKQNCKAVKGLII